MATLQLSTRDLAFFRYTFDLFPTPESPLRFLEDLPLEPPDADQTHASLDERGLLRERGDGASQTVIDRLEPVAECSARVMMRLGGRNTDRARDYYVFNGAGVEYRREGDEHAFGEPRSESALAAELAQAFSPRADAQMRTLMMSAGDYLVFAVFARDLRSRPEAEPVDDDSPMSVDEVLSYFAEPETKYIRTPSDDSWQRSVANLCEAGVLVESEGGYELDPSLRDLAREIVADHQHTVTRFDFLDEQWLVREVSLYPTEGAVYRLGTEPDGEVVIQELSTASLADVLAGVVTTLPSILNPDVPPVLRSHAAAR